MKRGCARVLCTLSSCFSFCVLACSAVCNAKKNPHGNILYMASNPNLDATLLDKLPPILPIEYVAARHIRVVATNPRALPVVAYHSVVWWVCAVAMPTATSNCAIRCDNVPTLVVHDCGNAFRPNLAWHLDCCCCCYCR